MRVERIMLVTLNVERANQLPEVSRLYSCGFGLSMTGAT